MTTTIKTTHGDFKVTSTFKGDKLWPADEKKHAFYCFLSDAISAKQSFEDFCSEIGYDTDSRKAENIYKACQRSLAKLERLFSGDCYDLINEVQELTNA